MKRFSLQAKVFFLIGIFRAGSLSGCATGKWGFIDKDEKVAFTQQFEEATPFGDGLAGLKVGGKWGFIDKTGKMAIEPQFDAVWRFHEGLAAVMTGGKWGFVDKAGAFAIPPQFTDATPFSVSFGRTSATATPPEAPLATVPLSSAPRSGPRPR